MRGSRNLVVIIAVVASALVAGHAASQDGQDAKGSEQAMAPYTVADFAVSLAQSLHLTPPEGKKVFTPESASWALWQSGVRIQADSRKVLTEEVLAATISQLGFNVVPSEADRIVTAEKAGTALATFINSDTLERLRAGGAKLAGNGGDDFNNGNGKGGKFKRKNDKSPGTSD